MGVKILKNYFFEKTKNCLIEGGIVRSEVDAEKKLYSQDLIKWKIIEWGIENKMMYYDLAGYNPNPQDQKEAGIKRYKQKWGGVEHNYWKILGIKT